MMTSRQMHVLVALLIAGLLCPAGALGGVAFSLGSNADGRTGLGTDSDNTLTPTMLDTTHLGSLAIEEVSAGGAYGLVLTETGSVFSFGSNANGQTGLGTDSGTALVPTAIDTTNLGSSAVTAISAGDTHALLIDDSGLVFSFGRNNAGRTGQGTPNGLTTVAKQINDPTDTTNWGQVTKVAAGQAHSLVLTEDGHVFSFGVGTGGRTGLNASSGNTTVATAIHTTNLAGKTITDISASTHSLIVDSDGIVYSFGANTSGETGQGSTGGSTLIATQIDQTNLDDVVITKAVAGTNYSLLLADDGTVFSFGTNANGRTGLDTTIGSTTVATAIDTTNLGGFNIIDIAAGSDYSLLLADDGSLFGFGSNADGKLGFGTDFTDVLVATAIDTSMVPGFVFTGISAGTGNSTLLVGIPEPSSLLLLGVGGLLVISRRRRAACGV